MMITAKTDITESSALKENLCNLHPYLSLLHLNIRSMRNKQDELDIWLNSLQVNFDALMFTETWLNETDASPTFNNYIPIRLDRIGRGGGLVIYLQRNYTYHVVDECTMVNSDLECLVVETSLFLVAVLYRPPTGYKRHFLKHLENMLLYCLNAKKQFFILGDVNINTLSSDTHAQDLMDLVSSYGCQNAINMPTRITPNSSTSIDICITNLNESDYTAGVLSCDISDHLPIFIAAQHVLKGYPNYSRLEYRAVSDSSLHYFYSLIEHADWSSVYQQQNANSAYDVFLGIFLHCYNHAFPLRPYKKRNRKIKKPWIDAVLLKRIKKKNNMFHKFLESRDASLFKEFKKFRNKLNSDIKKAKCIYYESMFSRIRGDPAKIWRQVNCLTGRNFSPVRADQIAINGSLRGKELADEINKHFVNIAMSHLPVQQCVSNWPSRQINSFVLEAVTSTEISDLIIHLKNNVASGYDDIKVEPIKHVSLIISPILVHVINLMFSTGVFPDKLKLAKVIPVHKGGRADDIMNYRPISVLPVFSKIFELSINIRLSKYLSKYDIISPSQYGFQKNKTTEDALLSAKQKIVGNFENQLYTLGIFLDLRKAFDSVDHNILVTKLDRYGIRGITLELIKSYLSFRRQFVKTDSAYSQQLDVKLGVPQGSILGPLLFLLYVNDITELETTPTITMFADDTSLFFTGKSLHVIEQSANLYLNELSLWLQQNKLQLNAQKTKYIVFKPINKDGNKTVNLVYRGHNLEQVRVQKFLGVWFSEDLSWTPHVSHLRSDLAKSVGCLRKIAALLPLWLQQSLYYSMFYSKLLYGILVWGTTTKGNYEKLLILQKRVLRIFMNYTGPIRLLETQPLFQKFDVLPANKVYLWRLARQIYKHKLYTIYTPVAAHYDIRNPKRKPKKVRTNYGKQDMEYQVIDMLNRYDSSLDFSLPKKSFKRECRAILFSAETVQ